MDDETIITTSDRVIAKASADGKKGVIITGIKEPLTYVKPDPRTKLPISKSTPVDPHVLSSPPPQTIANIPEAVPVPTLQRINNVNLQLNQSNIAYSEPIQTTFVATASGPNGAIQFNLNGASVGSANLMWAQNGLFVGGVPTSLDATGIITARNEFRFGIWSRVDGANTDKWGRIRLGDAFSSNTFYGFRGDPDITNPNRTVVITNEEQDVSQALVLMDGVAYNTLSPNSEGTIFGVSVRNQGTYKPTTGFESGWNKLINVTNKGNVKIGGSIVISPSYQIIPPANNTVGIYFADGTFQYTAATGNGSANIAVYENDTLLTSTLTSLNFSGDGVQASNTGNAVDIIISGTQVNVLDEGSNVVLGANTLNFVGSGVVASNVGGVATITIPGPGIDSVYDKGNISGTTVFDIDDGNIQTCVAIGNVYLDCTMLTSGQSMTILITQDSTGNRLLQANTMGWLWAAQYATLSTAPNITDMINLVKIGSDIYATLTVGYGVPL